MPDFHRRMSDRLRSPEQVWIFLTAEKIIVYIVTRELTLSFGCVYQKGHCNLRVDHFFKVANLHVMCRWSINMTIDRVVASEHLPLAHTRSTDAEELQLMGALEDLKKTFKGHWNTVQLNMANISTKMCIYLKYNCNIIECLYFVKIWNRNLLSNGSRNRNLLWIVMNVMQWISTYGKEQNCDERHFLESLICYKILVKHNH